MIWKSARCSAIQISWVFQNRREKKKSFSLCPFKFSNGSAETVTDERNKLRLTDVFTWSKRGKKCSKGPSLLWSVHHLQQRTLHFCLLTYLSTILFMLFILFLAHKHRPMGDGGRGKQSRDSLGPWYLGHHLLPPGCAWAGSWGGEEGSWGWYRTLQQWHAGNSTAESNACPSAFWENVARLRF